MTEINEKDIIALLEYFEKLPPFSQRTIQDITNQGFQNALLFEARETGLIEEMHEQFYRIKYEGLSFLSNYRTRKAIEKLNESIQEFDKKSSLFAKVLIALTIVLVFLTVALIQPVAKLLV